VLRRRFLPTISIAGVLLLLALVNVGVIRVKDHRRIDKLDAQMTEIFRQTLPGTSRIVDPLSQMRAGVSEMQRRAQALGIYGGNVTALGVLREISGRVPPGVDVTITDLSIDEARIRVHGTTPSYELVDKLKTELAQVPFFREVNVADVKTDRDGGKSFNLTITMGTPGAPVAPAAVAPRRRGA
jgi:general secretion pathway protein L